MAKYTVIVAVALMFMLPVARAQAADHQVGVVPADTPQMQDKTKEGACECCQKCKAAKSTIKSQEEEGPVAKDGCEDCCAECGQVLKPEPEATPPEVIEKHVPPASKPKPEE